MLTANIKNAGAEKKEKSGFKGIFSNIKIANHIKTENKTAKYLFLFSTNSLFNL